MAEPANLDASEERTSSADDARAPAVAVAPSQRRLAFARTLAPRAAPGAAPAPTSMPSTPTITDAAAIGDASLESALASPEPPSDPSLDPREDLPAFTDEASGVAPDPSEESGMLEPSLSRIEGTSAEAFDEFEGGALPSESTRIDADQVLAEESTRVLADARGGPTLVVEAGKDVGRDFVLHEGSNAVGRGIDNDVILTDISVSRRHLRLELDPSGITLVDLGSGNGTLLNGERVHQARIASGDRIEIGETVLVVDLPGLERPAPLGPASFETTNDESLPATPHAPGMPSWTPSPSEFPDPSQSNRSIFVPGNQVAVTRGALAVAAAALVVIASMIGAVAMALLLYRAPTSAPIALPIAPPAPSVGVPPLATPAPATPTSPTVSPAASPAAGPATAPIVAPARASDPTSPASNLPVGSPPAATAPAPSPTTAPTSERAGATPPAAAPAPSPTPSRRVADARADDPRAARRGAAAPGGRTRESAASGGGQPDPRILAAYRRQAFAEASQFARAQADAAQSQLRTTLTQMAQNIDTFARRLPEARRGNLSALEEAHRLDQRISGGQGAFAAELLPGLASGYVARARGNIATRPAEACRDVRAALGVAPQHAQARALFHDCEARARQTLGEAQRLEASDPARARTLYGQVTSMVGMDHALAHDATARLVAMNRTSPPRRRPVDEDE